MRESGRHVERRTESNKKWWKKCKKLIDKMEVREKKSREGREKASEAITSEDLEKAR